MTHTRTSHAGIDVPAGVVGEPLPVLIAAYSFSGRGHTQEVEKHIHLLVDAWLLGIKGVERDIAACDVVENLEEPV
jgi:hypothetical protein